MSSLTQATANLAGTSVKGIAFFAGGLILATGVLRA